MEYDDDLDDSLLDVMLCGTGREDKKSTESFNCAKHFSRPGELSDFFSKANFVKRRRLPGPAGLLPKQIDGRDVSDNRRRDFKRKKVDQENSSSFLSQSTESECEESELLALVKEDCGPLIWPLVEKYTISSVLQSVTQGLLPRRKIPVICGFLDDVELLPMDAKAVLKDRTGSVGCTIHRSVIKEYKEQLANCSILLLKQVSLFSPTGKRFYINITLPNVVRVYTVRKTLPSLVNSNPLGHTVGSRNSPFTIVELDALEAECLRPVSPPPVPVAKSISDLPGCITPTQRRSNGNCQPTVSRSSVSSSENISLSPDSSAYRLQSCTSAPLSRSFGFKLPQPRPGLGSLVRTPLRSLSCLTNVNQQQQQQQSEVSPSSTSLLQGLPIDSIMDDNMDDLLCSLADESQHL